jgi:hypothetical protein
MYCREAWISYHNKNIAQEKEAIMQLIKIMNQLNSDPENIELLEIASIAANKVDPTVWETQRLRRGERHGTTPLHYLMSALANNPKNTELIKITGIVADKVDRSAWSMLDSTGDTALRLLMIALNSNPDSKELIEIANIVANKVDTSAWLKGCWVVIDQKHDCNYPLSNLIAAFSSAETGPSKEKIATIWLVLLSKLNIKNKKERLSASSIQSKEFARNKEFLLNILKSDECNLDQSEAANTNTLLGKQFLHRNWGWGQLFSSNGTTIPQIKAARAVELTACEPVS